MWISVAILLASLVISFALTPKIPDPTPASLSDFDIPQSAEGTPQAVVFGDVWITGWMVLGMGNYRTSPIKVHESILFGLASESQVVGFTYYMGVDGLCDR